MTSSLLSGNGSSTAYPATKAATRIAEGRLVRRFDTSSVLATASKPYFQISAWKLRGNLPHAVESSWLLSEALLADELTAQSISVFAIKASYITAISRHVCSGSRQ